MHPTRRKHSLATAYSYSRNYHRQESRLRCPDEELDRVLGGGLVPGSVTHWAVNPELGNPPFCYKYLYNCNTRSCMCLEKRVNVKSNLELTVFLLKTTIALC